MLLICRTRPAAEKQDAILLVKFTFDKELVVRRVTQVGRLFVQDNLRVAGEGQNT